jgi:hypothetical protein
VVLEAGERLLPAWLELAFEENVADHPLRARGRVQGQQADAWQLVAALVAVGTAEQLIPAADG